MADCGAGLLWVLLLGIVVCGQSVEFKMCGNTTDTCPQYIQELEGGDAYIEVQPGWFYNYLEYWMQNRRNGRLLLYSRYQMELNKTWLPFKTDNAGTHGNFTVYMLPDETRYVYAQNEQQPMKFFDLWSTSPPANPFLPDKPSYLAPYVPNQFVYQHWLILDGKTVLDLNTIYDLGQKKYKATHCQDSCFLMSTFDLNMIKPIGVIPDTCISLESKQLILDQCFKPGKHCTMDLDTHGKHVIVSDEHVLLHHMGMTLIKKFGKAHGKLFYILEYRGLRFYFPLSYPYMKTFDDQTFIQLRSKEREFMFPVFNETDVFMTIRDEIVAQLQVNVTYQSTTLYNEKYNQLKQESTPNYDEPWYVVDYYADKQNESSWKRRI